jgi:two-component system, OmpR family, sensor kinase
MNPGSLRMRVTTWYVSLLATALMVFGATLYFAAQDYLMATLKSSLTAEALAISSNFVSLEESKGVRWMSGEIVESYAPEQSGRFIRITRQDGTVLYQSGDSREPSIDVDTISPIVANRGAQPAFSEMRDRAQHLLLCTLPYVSASGTTYLIETGASLAPVERVLRTLLKILLLIMPLILLAAALGGHFLMTRPLRPLVALTEQAERIGTHAPGERLPVIATGDEMERLSLSLNRMISRLEDALDHNRRFSADVSHELRTPLTILRGELEQVVQIPQLPEQTREMIGSSLEEIDRMARIVENLLAIARLQSGADRMELRRVNLSEIAQWTVDQMHLMADEKSVTIGCLQLNSAQILADPARIKQVLVNLLDNAIKYTPAGGEIWVSVATARRKAVLEVKDTGIGIPQQALPNLFQRFYRSDEARSRESGGTGLGLSIVQAICSAHGGTVAIESVEGAGTVVRVELPLTLATEVPIPGVGVGREVAPRFVAGRMERESGRKEPASSADGMLQEQS